MGAGNPSVEIAYDVPENIVVWFDLDQCYGLLGLGFSLAWEH